MNDTFPSILNIPDPPKTEEAPSGSPADQGLRSSQGIRWLLLAGALVCGVSVYRLVQAQWDILPAPFQFLTLVAAALAIFSLGSLTRRRLHLPYAGSALLSLFAGLIPVLAWGAAYLNLLTTAFGWLALGAGLAALLGAAQRVLRIELGYSGRLYPAILGLLLGAQAVLPWLAGHISGAGRQGIYVAAALVLGALFHAGSLHINRFFFHRDRRDGVERTLHFLPFLLLGTLYVGALTLLDLGSTFLALPLAIVGMVLATTGEEYYQALARSLGTAPERWPGRSVGLIALGLGLLTFSLPLSLMDASDRCLALVSLGATLFLARWGLRHRSAAMYGAGLVAAFIAYPAARVLVRPVTEWVVGKATGFTGLSTYSPALWALGQLGFFALLVAGLVWLRRIDAPERLRKVHAVTTALHLAAMTCLALADPDGTLLVLPLVLCGAVAGAALGRRPEIALAAAAPGIALAGAMWRHGLPLFEAALLSQALFVVSWLLSRKRESFVAPGARASAFGHAALGLMFLGQAVLQGAVGIEPLILLLVGLALLDEGLRDRRRELTGQGLGLLAAFPVVQIGLTAGFADTGLSWTVGLMVSGALLALLILIARRMAPKKEAWTELVLDPLSSLVRLWSAAAVVLCLIFTGWDLLALACALVALVFLARTSLAGRAPWAALPLRPALLLILQLVALPHWQDRYLVDALLDQGFQALPLAALLVLGWRFLVERLGRRWPLEPWVTLAEGSVATLLLSQLFFLVLADLTGIGWLRPDGLSTVQHLLLMGTALLWSGLSFAAGRRSRRASDAWAVQIWAGLALSQAFVAGWLVLGGAVTPYILLGAGVGFYVLAQWLERTGLREPFFGPCRTTGLLLPLAAGLLALYRMDNVAPDALWFPALSAFLVSLFYLVVASREARRIFPSLASAGLLGLALLVVFSRAGLGTELYSLAPGLSLLTLAWLLRAELGPTWSRHAVAAGASCLYATPILALSDRIEWGWLAALLVLAVSFGAASFGLRSRSLLTVSTAALLTDLGFFLFRIGTTAPTALWVLGALFGLAVMGAAAWLEYQREGILQQIRVFGRELRAWS